MRLLLVAPTWLPSFWNEGETLAPPLALPVLASLSPSEAHSHLVDENVAVNRARDRPGRPGTAHSGLAADDHLPVSLALDHRGRPDPPLTRLDGLTGA